MIIIILTIALYCKKGFPNGLSYQRYGIDSVESADSVLQLLTREPTQKIADGAHTAHEDIDVHPRLQRGW